jgi:hypothetical protein
MRIPAKPNRPAATTANEHGSLVGAILNWEQRVVIDVIENTGKDYGWILSRNLTCQAWTELECGLSCLCCTGKIGSAHYAMSIVKGASHRDGVGASIAAYPFLSLHIP